MQIAIDGPASSGKSTIARIIATQRNFLYLDTGAMYRCVTLYLLQHNVNLNDEKLIEAELKNITIQFENEESDQRVLLNGQDVTLSIRTDRVTNAVSLVSSYKTVRDYLVQQQKEIAQHHSIIMDGRDIGTVVLPNAQLKIFLIASAEERATRRMRENQLKGMDVSYEQLLKEIKERDRADSTRLQSPLVKAQDAIEIDTTKLTIEQVVHEINRLIDTNLT